MFYNNQNPKIYRTDIYWKLNDLMYKWLAKPYPQFNKRKRDMAPFDAYLQSCLGVKGYEKC